MSPFLAELIGTAMIIVFGEGVVSNVVLARTKGNNSGWIVITFGWAMGVFCGVFIAAPYSGAHLNPAVTLGLLAIGKFPASQVPVYIAAQMLGAMLGAFLVWIAYRKHFEATTDPDAMLAVFCTAPNIRSFPNNLATEIIGTFILVFGVLYLAKPEVGLGALDALPVALVVFGIGLSLGGPTGYAINPARDLGPRIMHAILPIPGKRDSDWQYAWVPVAGPVIGCLLAAAAFHLMH